MSIYEHTPNDRLGANREGMQSHLSIVPSDSSAEAEFTRRVHLIADNDPRTTLNNVIEDVRKSHQTSEDDFIKRITLARTDPVLVKDELEHTDLLPQVPLADPEKFTLSQRVAGEILSRMNLL